MPQFRPEGADGGADLERAFASFADGNGLLPSGCTVVAAASGPDGSFRLAGAASGGAFVFVLGGGWVSRGLTDARADGPNPFFVKAGTGSARAIVLAHAEGRGGLALADLGEAHLVLTDDLIRESLRRGGPPSEAGDEPEEDEEPEEEAAPQVRFIPAPKRPKPKADKPVKAKPAKGPGPRKPVITKANRLKDRDSFH